MLGYRLSAHPTQPRCSPGPVRWHPPLSTQGCSHTNTAVNPIPCITTTAIQVFQAALPSQLPPNWPALFQALKASALLSVSQDKSDFLLLLPEPLPLTSLVKAQAVRNAQPLKTLSNALPAELTSTPLALNPAPATSMYKLQALKCECAPQRCSRAGSTPLRTLLHTQLPPQRRMPPQKHHQCGSAKWQLLYTSNQRPHGHKDQGTAQPHLCQ